MYVTYPFKRISNWLIDLVFIAIVFGLFYATWLGSYALFTPDEGRYSEIAREMVVTGDFVTPRLNGVAFFDKPAMHYWLQAISIQLFGIKEWALRFWPAFFGVLSCIFVYVGGRTLFSRRAGIISAVILATNPLYFAIAHYANLDSELTAFVSGSLLCFIMAMNATTHQAHRLLLLFAYLFCGLAVLTKGLIGIAFPALIIGSWILLLNRWQVIKSMHLITGILIILAIAAPWYMLVQKANPQFFHFFVVLQQFSRFLSKTDFNNETVIWFYVPVILISFLPWSFFLFQALVHHIKSIWKNREHQQKELYFILWFVIILMFFSIPKSKTISRIVPIMPALALIVGIYLDKCWDYFKGKGIYFGALFYIIFSQMAGISLFILTYLLHDKLDLQLIPPLVVIGAILSISAIVGYWLFKKNQFSNIFYCMSLTAGLVLLAMTYSASIVNVKSIKPMATLLKSKLEPQDEVVTYYRYYQDLPIYIEKRITIVSNWDANRISKRDNWKREMWFNMPYQDTSDWLIKETVFWKRWASDQRLFVLIEESSFDQFLSNQAQIKQSNKPIHILGTTSYNNKRVILVSNFKEKKIHN